MSRDESNLLRATGASLGRVWRDPGLRRMVSGIAAFHFCLSSLPVLLPFLAEDRLALSGKWLGMLYVSYTAGIMVGCLAAGFVAGLNKNREVIIAVAAASVGFLFCVAGTTEVVWLTIPALFCIGAGIGLIVVNLMTEVQLATDESERGRIMGAVKAVGGCSLPIGMALFGLMLDLAGRAGSSRPTTTAVLLTGCGVSAILVGWWMWRGGRRG